MKGDSFFGTMQAICNLDERKPAEPIVELVDPQEDTPREILDVGWGEVVEGVKSERPAAPAFELNDEQKAAVDAVRAFLFDPTEQFFGLFGYAGTGKTTVIQHVFSDPNHEAAYLHVAMSAPTHKAVGVLADMAEERGLHRFDFRTIHSLCDVRKTYDNGRVFFEPKVDPYDRKIRLFDVVILDECSMVSEEMWAWINESVRWDWMHDERMTKVIVMGDPAQLPPVGATYSPTFDVEHVTLSKIMRSRGCVQDAATAIRLKLDSARPLLARNARDEHGEIVNIAQNAWLDELYQAVETYDLNVKALAFTNKAVNRINKWIRDRKFGPDAEPFRWGERLVTVDTYEDKRSGFAVHTETELVVRKTERATFTVEDFLGDPVVTLNCWSLEVETRHKVKFHLYALDEEQKPAYRKAIKAIKDKAKKAAKRKERGAWFAFYALSEAFANVRPGWATTIHKSQGSTYDRVYLLQSDALNARQDVVLRNRLLYVGYSRAKSGLYLA